MSLSMVYDGYLYHCYPFRTRVFKSGKTKLIPKLHQSMKKPIKLDLVRMATRRYEFSCHT